MQVLCLGSLSRLNSYNSGAITIPVYQLSEVSLNEGFLEVEGLAPGSFPFSFI